jgi:hypothetical protein
MLAAAVMGPFSLANGNISPACVFQELPFVEAVDL